MGSHAIFCYLGFSHDRPSRSHEAIEATGGRLLTALDAHRSDLTAAGARLHEASDAALAGDRPGAEHALDSALDHLEAASESAARAASAVAQGRSLLEETAGRHPEDPLARREAAFARLDYAALYTELEAAGLTLAAPSLWNAMAKSLHAGGALAALPAVSATLYELAVRTTSFARDLEALSCEGLETLGHRLHDQTPETARLLVLAAKAEQQLILLGLLGDRAWDEVEVSLLPAHEPAATLAATA